MTTGWSEVAGRGEPNWTRGQCVETKIDVCVELITIIR
jgi:hypothetical protein